jgi:hypothetical protein
MSTSPSSPTRSDQLIRLGGILAVVTLIGGVIAIPIMSQTIEGLKLDVGRAQKATDDAGKIAKSLGDANQELQRKVESLVKAQESQPASESFKNEQKAIDSAKKYYSLIRDKDWSNAYKQATTEYQTEVLESPDNLALQWKGTSPELISSSIASFKSDNAVIVYGQLLGGRPNVDYVVIKLTAQENGNWKIDETKGLENLSKD